MAHLQEQPLEIKPVEEETPPLKELSFVGTMEVFRLHSVNSRCLDTKDTSCLSAVRSVTVCTSKVMAV